jgi:hypothetical protein
MKAIINKGRKIEDEVVEVDTKVGEILVKNGLSISEV